MATLGALVELSLQGEAGGRAFESEYSKRVREALNILLALLRNAHLLTIAGTFWL